MPIDSSIVPGTLRGLVDVPARVVGHRRDARARVLLEQEELDLRVGVEGEAQV
jgi:hypothetical protein